MLDSLRQYWYMYVVLVVLIVIVAWGTKKASAAVRKRRESLAKQTAELERYKYLVEKYRDADESIIQANDSVEVCEGVCSALQYEIERSDKGMIPAFNAADKKRQIAYSVWYFIEDCRVSLSHFYRANGRPVTSMATEFLKSAGLEKMFQPAAASFAMYDEENDRVSLDKSYSAQLDEKFASVFDERAICDAAKKMLLEKID